MNPVREMLEQLVTSTELVTQTKQALDTALMLQANKTGEVIALLRDLDVLSEQPEPVAEEALDDEPDSGGSPPDEA